MAATDVTPMECGYCLRKDSMLVDPKVLPCSHTHCLGCLTAFFNRHHIVRCPKCSEMYDVTLDSLPTASPVGDDSPSCDVCTDKGVRDQPAVIYCTTCSRKFCAKHQESHDDIYGTHTKIEISEYRTLASKLEMRACTEHGVRLSMGCKTCLTVICVKCTNDLGTCSSGVSHEMNSLDELVENLTKEVNESKAEVTEKEEKLETLFKKTSKIIADYETETGEMIERIHQRRDEQIQAITVKYQNLEKELVELRAQFKAAMTQFMEENVGRKLSDLTGHRMRIEARVRHSHEVDIVAGHRDTMDQIRRLLDEVIPEFELEKTCKLDSRGECRDVELELSCTKGFINWSDGLTTSPPIPKSLVLQKTVRLSKPIISVCCYQGITYAGLQYNAISRIDSSYQLTNSFITFGGRVEGVIVYKDRLYSLVQGSPYKVSVHDLSGQLITSWSHTDSGNYSGFTRIADDIIIPDRANKRLTVYSLSGQILRHLPCPQLSKGYVLICAAGADSVIVSDYPSNQVFRVSVSTGDVIWISSPVTQPLGVVCYRESCVLVASYNNDKIRILDMNTGSLLSEMTLCDAFSHIFDLHISGKTLIVPAYGNQQVLYYQMR